MSSAAGVQQPRAGVELKVAHRNTDSTLAFHLAQKDSSDNERSWSLQRCMFGLSYGAPFKLAAGIAGGMVYQHPQGGADVCVFGGAKLGFGAARASLGIARTIGALGGGAAVSAGFLRTFSGAPGAEPRTSYAGVSLHLFPLLALGGEIGWYQRLGSEPGDNIPRSIVTWSAGFGF